MSEVPRPARVAAILFLVYGALVLVAAVYGQAGSAAGAMGLFRLSVRVIGIVLIAVGLFRGAHWAWLLGVVFGGFWLLMGGIGAAALATSDEGMDVTAGFIAVLAAMAILATAWALLLTARVRQAYRDQRR